MEILAALSLLLCLPVAITGDSNLSRLREDLLYRSGIDPKLMPSVDKELVKVTLSIDLVKLLDVDKERNELEVLVWQTLQWTSPNFRWNPADYGNITSFVLPVGSMWTPDITLVNSLKTPEVISPNLVVVNHDGTVLTVPSMRLRFGCDLQDIDSASGVNCTMKFMSWTMNSRQYSLGIPDPPSDYQRLYLEHPRYRVLGSSVEKELRKYSENDIYVAYKFIYTIGEVNTNAATRLLTQNNCLLCVLFLVAKVALSMS